MTTLFFWLALAVAAPAVAAPNVANVHIDREGTSWIADFELKADAPVWAFQDSILPRESPCWSVGPVRLQASPA